MEAERVELAGVAGATARRIVLESSGVNVVVRVSGGLDLVDTISLVDAINAATRIGLTVVVDPEPVHCDDAIARCERSGFERWCSTGKLRAASAADVVGAGIIGLRTETSHWLIDVHRGCFVQLAGVILPHLLDPEAWRSLVAVCITPTMVISVDAGGALTSSRRALVPTAA